MKRAPTDAEFRRLVNACDPRMAGAVQLIASAGVRLVPEHASPIRAPSASAGWAWGWQLRRALRGIPVACALGSDLRYAVVRSHLVCNRLTWRPVQRGPWDWLHRTGLVHRHGLNMWVAGTNSFVRDRYWPTDKSRRAGIGATQPTE